MRTCESTDFWGLHKNMNCAFPLTKLSDVLKNEIVKKTVFDDLVKKLLRVLILIIQFKKMTITRHVLKRKEKA